MIKYEIDQVQRYRYRRKEMGIRFLVVRYAQQGNPHLERRSGIPAVREKMAVLHGQEPGTYGKPALRCDEAPSAVVVALCHAEPPENRAGNGRRYAPFRIRNGGGGFATPATQHEMDRHL